MSRRDFSKSRATQIVAQKGFEDINGGFFGQPTVKPRRPTKADLRKEAGAAIAGAKLITKIIQCQCGHKGKVRIPVARVRGPFRCVVCKTKRM